MPIILPNGLTTPEIRLLQEFRRLNAETFTVDQVKAVKHPAGGGEAPAVSLVAKGFLTPAADNGGFALTQKAKDFLAIEAKPMFEETSTSNAAASAAADPQADGV